MVCTVAIYTLTVPERCVGLTTEIMWYSNVPQCLVMNSLVIVEGTGVTAVSRRQLSFPS